MAGEKSKKRSIPKWLERITPGTKSAKKIKRKSPNAIKKMFKNNGK